MNTTTNRRVRIVGDQWPPNTNTYVQLDCSRTIDGNISKLAYGLSVEESEIRSKYTYHSYLESGKVGPAIKAHETLSVIDARPLLWLKKIVQQPTTTCSGPSVETGSSFPKQQQTINDDDPRIPETIEDDD